MKKRITILGSTGSIGVSALDVIKDSPERFEVIGLTAGGNVDLLEMQIKRFKPKYAAVIDRQNAIDLTDRLNGLDTEIYYGMEGLVKISTAPETDTVVSSIVGAAGLTPTISAIRKDKMIALANKETLVMAGSLINKETNGRPAILPVDSEHSAIFQSLHGEDKRHIKKLIITASGGPFRNLTVEQLHKVTPKDALEHPNWKMGKKITIDSATLMNKGLEVIEAKWLFGVNADQIDVAVHPQSIVHSLVEFIDGSVIAQLGMPDMRLPIAYALNYPERCETNITSLNLTEIGTLTFEQPDTEKFPCLKFAFDALKAGGTMPAVLNAANEIAVEAFLEHKISFMEIPRIILSTMEEHDPSAIKELSDILEADRWARKKAQSNI